MVNYGRSSACVTCKQRKVKCDKSKPGCLKCRKIGKSCPGYPDEWDLAFRSENGNVQRKVYQNAIPSTKPLMLRKDFVDERLHAIGLFFQDYTISRCGPCPGWLHFLPKMYQMSTETSLLHHAVCTAAYANLAQKTDRPDLAIMAMSHYRESLEIVKQTLVLPKTALDDSTMTGVMLLGMYECINSTLAEDPQYHHSSGLETLADLRGSLLMRGYGPNLLQIVCCQSQRRNLDRKTAPTAADERLIQMLDPSLLSNQMIINKFQVSKFVANVEVKTRFSRMSDRWHEIFRDFQRIESDHLDWAMQASLKIGFIQNQQPVPSADSEPLVYHSYLGFWTLSLWNKHRASRILLHQSLLESLDARLSSSSNPGLSTADQKQYVASKLIIEQMADFVFASIPFSLCDVPLPSCLNGPKSVGGYFLVWTLQVILRCHFLSEPRRKRASDALLRVGRKCGISYATIFAQRYSPSTSPEDFEAPATMHIC